MDLKSYKDKIFIARGVAVMLDCDAAHAVDIDTNQLNENTKRSPKWEYLREIGIEERYKFTLTQEEFNAVLGCRSLRHPNDTLKNRKSPPTVYTRLGCAYLATSLNNVAACNLAIELSELYFAYTTGKLKCIPDSSDKEDVNSIEYKTRQMHNLLDELVLVNQVLPQIERTVNLIMITGILKLRYEEKARIMNDFLKHRCNIDMSILFGIDPKKDETPKEAVIRGPASILTPWYPTK